MTTTSPGGHIVILDGAGRDNYDGHCRQVTDAAEELAQASRDGHRPV